jgi:hypothetical protein
MSSDSLPLPPPRNITTSAAESLASLNVLNNIEPRQPSTKYSQHQQPHQPQHQSQSEKENVLMTAQQYQAQLQYQPPQQQQKPLQQPSQQYSAATALHLQHSLTNTHPPSPLQQRNSSIEEAKRLSVAPSATSNSGDVLSSGPVHSDPVKNKRVDHITDTKSAAIVDSTESKITMADASIPVADVSDDTLADKEEEGEEESILNISKENMRKPSAALPPKPPLKQHSSSFSNFTRSNSGSNGGEGNVQSPTARSALAPVASAEEKRGGDDDDDDEEDFKYVNELKSLGNISDTFDEHDDDDNDDDDNNNTSSFPVGQQAIPPVKTEQHSTTPTTPTTDMSTPQKQPREDDLAQGSSSLFSPTPSMSLSKPSTPSSQKQKQKQQQHPDPLEQSSDSVISLLQPQSSPQLGGPEVKLTVDCTPTQVLLLFQTLCAYIETFTEPLAVRKGYGAATSAAAAQTRSASVGSGVGLDRQKRLMQALLATRDQEVATFQVEVACALLLRVLSENGEYILPRFVMHVLWFLLTCYQKNFLSFFFMHVMSCVRYSWQLTNCVCVSVCLCLSEVLNGVVSADKISKSHKKLGGGEALPPPPTLLLVMSLLLSLLSYSDHVVIFIIIHFILTHYSLPLSLPPSSILPPSSPRRHVARYHRPHESHDGSEAHASR